MARPQDGDATMETKDGMAMYRSASSGEYRRPVPVRMSCAHRVERQHADVEEGGDEKQQPGLQGEAADVAQGHLVLTRLVGAVLRQHPPPLLRTQRA